jgi:putative glutamine amidotransferase
MSASRIELDEVRPERRRESYDPDAPHVSVLVSFDMPGMTDHVGELMRILTRIALQELEDLGARWTVIDTSLPPDDVARALHTDAVLLLGGGDVDSELYGVDGPAPHEYGADARADRFCIDVIRSAVDADVPVLGICRGSQLINVAFGGTLVPDIEDSALHHGPGSDLFVDETVLITPGTRLRAVLGADELVVRTGHHQAVAEVAPALRLAAVALDGVVEAIEHPDAWVLGVQWHPEEAYAVDGTRPALFGALLGAARQRRAS